MIHPVYNFIDQHLVN